MNLENAIKLNKKVVLWGVGNNFHKHIDRIKANIEISNVCDSDENKWGKNIVGYLCIRPEELDENYYVIITIGNAEVVKEIKALLKEKSENCSLQEALDFIQIREEERFVEKHMDQLSLDDSQWNNKMMKYIGINVPSRMCNLTCPYCYIRQTSEFERNPAIGHSPRFIRWCLSQKKIGGQALIVICGSGETLFCDKIVEICVELLKEGHYLHIVTNGTVTEKIKELLDKAGKYVGHIFFKCSFHYEEFVRKNLLETFASNIKRMSEAGASFTVELTTDDNLLDKVDDIKRFSMEKFGALPHVTIARDETVPGLPLLTKMPEEEYYSFWSQFDSKLFEVKREYFGKPICNCYAGDWSIYMRLADGNIYKCLNHAPIDNLFTSSKSELKYERVNDDCTLPYCYNNHAYLTLGTCPDIMTYSFAEVRDRETSDGQHWVKQEVYDFINQKLYDNNR